MIYDRALDKRDNEKIRTHNLNVFSFSTFFLALYYNP